MTCTTCAYKTIRYPQHQLWTVWATSHYGQFPLKEPLSKLTYKGLGAEQNWQLRRCIFKFYISKQDTWRSEINYNRHFHQMYRPSPAPVVSVHMWICEKDEASRGGWTTGSGFLVAMIGAQTGSRYSCRVFAFFHTPPHLCVNGYVRKTGTIQYRPSQKVKLLVQLTNSEPSIVVPSRWYNVHATGWKTGNRFPVDFCLYHGVFHWASCVLEGKVVKACTLRTVKRRGAMPPFPYM